jgi:hypothetical protein
LKSELLVIPYLHFPSLPFHLHLAWFSPIQRTPPRTRPKPARPTGLHISHLLPFPPPRTIEPRRIPCMVLLPRGNRRPTTYNARYTIVLPEPGARSIPRRASYARGVVGL